MFNETEQCSTDLNHFGVVDELVGFRIHVALVSTSSIPDAPAHWPMFHRL